MRTAIAATALAALLSACASIDVPEVQGGPPLALEPLAADALSVRYIRVETTQWVYRDYQETTEPDNRAWRDPALDMEFTSTVEEELGEELSRCATGNRQVDVTVLVTSREADRRLRSLLDGNGADTLGAIVELVEPGPEGRVLGRYAVQVGARSGNLLERAVGDSLMNTAEMMGRDLCLQAFGRNPRPPSVLNATRG